VTVVFFGRWQSGVGSGAKREAPSFPLFPFRPDEDGAIQKKYDLQNY
jgi:hypothetical protein